MEEKCLFLCPNWYCDSFFEKVTDMKDAGRVKYDASHEAAFPVIVCRHVSPSLNSVLNPKQTDSTNHVFN